MKVTNMPNAREEAESDPKRPLILGDEHSLTYKVYYNANYSTVRDYFYHRVNLYGILGIIKYRT